MGYAFISYSSKDQASAEAMRGLLNEKGIRTWMAPWDIPAGSMYAKVINQAIKGCACFILILSDNAQNSIWVAKEVERAVNYRRPIIPVKIEDVLLNDEFEFFISTSQIVAVPNIERDTKEIRTLINSVIAFTGTDEVKPAPGAVRSANIGNSDSENVKKNQAKIEEIYIRANQYHEQGDYQNELQLLLKGLEIDPKNSDLLIKTGRVYRCMELYEKALKCYRAAEIICPTNPTIYSNIGVLFGMMEQYSMATLYLEKAIGMIEKDPSAAPADSGAIFYANYGLFLGKQGDLNRARYNLRLAKKKGCSAEKIKTLCGMLNISPNSI